MDWSIVYAVTTYIIECLSLTMCSKVAVMQQQASGGDLVGATVQGLLHRAAPPAPTASHQAAAGLAVTSSASSPPQLLKHKDWLLLLGMPALSIDGTTHMPDQDPLRGMSLDSVRRKRKLKMKRHKHKKRLKRMRQKNK